MKIKLKNPLKGDLNFHMGPSAEGEKIPLVDGEALMPDLKEGDLFSCKFQGEGFMEMIKAFLVEKKDIKYGEKNVTLDPEPVCGVPFEAKKILDLGNDIEDNCFKMEEWMEEERIEDYLPGFSNDKKPHQFTSIKEGSRFLEKLCQKSQHGYFFYLDQEQNIPAAVFTKALLSRKSDFNVLDAIQLINERDSLKVFYQAQIHGNEPAAGEGALAFAKMAAEFWPYDNVDMVVIPYVNLYGSEMFTRGGKNLINLNRDNLTLISEDFFLIHQIFLKLMPDVFIDGHEFRGRADMAEPLGRADGGGEDANMQSTFLDDIKIGCVNTFNRKAEINDREEKITKEVLFNLEEKGFRSFFFKPSVAPSTSCNYARLMGCLAFLVESRGIGIGKKNFKRRVLSQRETVQGILDKVSKEWKAIKEMVAEGRDEIIKSETFVIHHEKTGLKVMEKERVAFDFKGKQVKECSGLHQMAQFDKAARTRNLPKAYLIDRDCQGAEWAKEILVKNGATYNSVTKNSVVSVRKYVVNNEIGEVGEVIDLHLPEGGYIFPMNQLVKHIIAASLEPEIGDANGYSGTFIQGNFLKREDGICPVYRIDEM